MILISNLSFIVLWSKKNITTCCRLWWSLL